MGSLLKSILLELSSFFILLILLSLSYTIHSKDDAPAYGNYCLNSSKEISKNTPIYWLSFFGNEDEDKDNNEDKTDWRYGFTLPDFLTINFRNPHNNILKPIYSFLSNYFSLKAFIFLHCLRV